MITKIKTFTLNVIAGANVVSAILMLLIGYSDRINPTEHPLTANAGLLFPIILAANVGFLVFFSIFKKRYTLITLAGLTAGYAPVRTYCPLNIEKDAPKNTIKVMSYNVHYFDNSKATEDNPNPILNYILNSGADIVCMQEAKLNGKIEEEIKGIYNYKDSVLSPSNGNGLLVFSRYPILSKEKIKYKSRNNLSAAFKIRIKGETVTVINNHFETSGLSTADRNGFNDMVKGKSTKDTVRAESKRLLAKLGEATAIRAPQAEAVAEYIRKTDGNVILCGDFNDTPISYTHHVLAKELTDCHTSTANGPGFTYKEHAMFVRIDNIMCSKSWIPYNCKVDKSNNFSDHHPIYCHLERAGKPKND